MKLIGATHASMENAPLSMIRGSEEGGNAYGVVKRLNKIPAFNDMFTKLFGKKDTE